jgi:hypothetical protein
MNFLANQKKRMGRKKALPPPGRRFIATLRRLSMLLYHHPPCWKGIYPNMQVYVEKRSPTRHDYRLMVYIYDGHQLPDQSTRVVLATTQRLNQKKI